MKLPIIKPIISRIVSIQFFAKTIIFTTLYIVSAFVVANFSMIQSILQLPYPVLLKLKLLGYSLWGYLNSSNSLGTTTLMLIALLFGINFAFILSQKIFVKQQSQKRFLFLTSFASLLTTGCAACGIQLSSLAGITGALSLLPFQGLELSVIVLAILAFSITIHIKALYKSCALA